MTRRRRDACLEAGQPSHWSVVTDVDASPDPPGLATALRKSLRDFSPRLWVGEPKGRKTGPRSPCEFGRAFGSRHRHEP